MPQQKTEFQNMSGGIVGVVTIEPGGKPVAIPVRPDATVWLSEEEQIATANAPQRDEDNPFINGQLVKVTDAADIKNRRPIGDNADSPEAAEQKRAAEQRAAEVREANEAQRREEEARLKQGQQAAQAGAKPGAVPTAPAAAPRQTAEETAAPPQPGGPAAQGTRAAGEEVGTPQAVPKG